MRLFIVIFMPSIIVQLLNIVISPASSVLMILVQAGALVSALALGYNSFKILTLPKGN